MKKLLLFGFFALTVGSTQAQSVYLSLDSCRNLAIANNKELLISQENINAARYQLLA